MFGTQSVSICCFLNQAVNSEQFRGKVILSDVVENVEREIAVILSNTLL